MVIGSHCINLQYVKLPYKVKALCVSNPDNSHTIIVNNRLSSEARKEAIIHELEHIKHDDFYSEEDASVIEYQRRQQ